MRYGVGYKGSKSQIAKDIIDFLPPGRRLIDLFGGGGAITHCAALSGKWETVIYSDIDPLIVSLCEDFFAGRYAGRTDIFGWVSREEFKRRKDTDPLVKWLWSFGTDGESYIYGVDKIPTAEAIHRAIADQEYSARFLALTGGRLWFRGATIHERRLEWVKFRRAQGVLSSNDHAQAITRLDTLTASRRLHNVRVLRRSYADYTYRRGDVVYCDIPYRGTDCGSYDGFDHAKFYEWARHVPCYISEYRMPPGFREVWQREKYVLSGRGGNNLKTTERLYRSPAANFVRKA